MGWRKESFSILSTCCGALGLQWLGFFCPKLCTYTHLTVLYTLFPVLMGLRGDPLLGTESSKHRDHSQSTAWSHMETQDCRLAVGTPLASSTATTSITKPEHCHVFKAKSRGRIQAWPQIQFPEEHLTVRWNRGWKRAHFRVSWRKGAPKI